MLQAAGASGGAEGLSVASGAVGGLSVASGAAGQRIAVPGVAGQPMTACAGVVHWKVVCAFLPGDAGDSLS